MKNKKRILIVGTDLTDDQLAIRCEKLYHLRTARKVGDIETVNHFVYGRLKDNFPNIQIKELCVN